MPHVQGQPTTDRRPSDDLRESGSQSLNSFTPRGTTPSAGFRRSRFVLDCRFQAGAVEMRNHQVEIWSEKISVSVWQKSKSVWCASGTYLGQSIDVADRSEGAALKRWREAARYKGG